MRLFFVFLSLLIISTPTAFAETITLKCDYKSTVYTTDHKVIDRSDGTKYFTIDLDAKTVSYIDGRPHNGYQTVSTEGGLITLRGITDLYYIIGKNSASINRYTGTFHEFSYIRTTEKSNVNLDSNSEAHGFCKPYTPQQLF